MNLKEIKIAIIVSDFNEKITSCLLENTVSRLREKQLQEDQIKIVHVPGAFEIPLLASKYINHIAYHCVICLGCVIRGETTHYDYICQETSRAIMDLNISSKKPVIFGILTTENTEQAEQRAGLLSSNLREYGETKSKEYNHITKGHEFADAALKMLEIMKED